MPTLRLLLAFSIICCAVAEGTRSSHVSKPNFVFILTDDQDLHLASMDYMPLVQKHLGRGGTFYRRHYCTIALCCPSRVSLLTGRMAHNTNVTDVWPPYGGYPKFVSQGLNDNYLPIWMQAEGYNTFYTGKLMNYHTILNWNDPLPRGWTAHDFLIDPGTYNYWNATFQRNQSPPVSSSGQYNTDLVRDKALGFLDDAKQGGKPFFLGVAPIGPHAGYVYGDREFTKPYPAKRHEGLFNNARVPRTYNYNPKDPSIASWISRLPLLNTTELAYFDEFYRARLQALQAVDELVDALISRLDKHNLLDNTYVIYTSDNGYHIGQHRLQPGKSCAIEEDINVPFYLRGPGVPRGETVDMVTSHTDIVPTLFELAGIKLREEFDGAPMPVGGKALSRESAREHVSVEFWGLGGDEGKFATGGVGAGSGWPNNTYKALRVSGDGYNLFYSVWCTNEHELYDMAADPGQMQNLASSFDTRKTILGRPISYTQSRLDALLMVLKSCKAKSCTDPWSVVHPRGDVRSLRDAMNAKYDDFYGRQPKVAFSKCEEGYIIESEGPQVGLAYDGVQGWPHWT